MTRFSANLGFLWADLPLTDAVHAAARAGFDAVECHWPYETPVEDVGQALRDAGLPMLGLNTRPGATGEAGLAAVPGREADARAHIDEALDYAASLGAIHVHVMAGNASGPEAEETFLNALRYACGAAAKLGLRIVIEPLNTGDAPGYFLSTTKHACRILDLVGADNLRLMFDCYHVGIMEGDIASRLTTLLPRIGHIQFADAPGRGAPGTGATDFAPLFAQIQRLGYSGPLGAEYRPVGPTEDSLRWMNALA